MVLATGLVPESRDGFVPEAALRDDFGFLSGDRAKGLDAIGCARRPADVVRSVQDATGAAIRTLQVGAGR